MFSTITEYLMHYCNFIDESNKATRLIEYASQNNKTENLDQLSENRERLIQIISQTQTKIEDLINKLPTNEINKENLEIIKSWSFDVNDWIAYTGQIDENILNNLENEKEETTKEIANMFKSKMAFRGYNLKNVSR